MAFTQQTYLGASISNWSLNIGWNTQQGGMTVQLVEDPDNGDSFTFPTIGSSTFFRYTDEDGNVVFEYGGLIQSWEQINAQEGKPIYQVSIVDPREVLAGAPVIIGAYNGNTKSVWNLINAYGFMEDDTFGTGFGGARVNEGGMPWNLIRTAISVITSANPSIAPQYGGPLFFRGEVYRVDLSSLPLAPNFYRIGGTHAYLLDMIDQLCNEAGHDYYIKLVDVPNLGNVIKINTVSRKLQPVLGKIAAFIGDGTNTVNSRRGQELRNEVTSAFLVGGNVTALYQVYGPEGGNEVQPTGCFIWPFWGVDDAGIPVIGDDPNTTNGPEDFLSDEHRFTVPATMVNVIGIGNSYTMDIGEVRAAIAGEAPWVSYMCSKRPDVAKAVGLIGDWEVMPGVIDKMKQGVAKISDLMNPKLKDQNGNVRNNADRLQNTKLLYQYVNQFAQGYYGRRFMVRLPIVASRVEEETQRLFHSYEIAEAGYVEDGAEPLGLPVYYEDFFKIQDGRFQAFCRYNNAATLDLSRMRPTDYVLANNQLFVRCDVDPQFYFMNLQKYSEPRAVITTPNIIAQKYDSTAEPLTDKEAGITVQFEARLKPGLDPQVNASGHLTHQTKQNLKHNLDKTHAGGLPFSGLGEKCVMPDWVAIPLRSNTLTYGPWYRIGPNGKTYYEQDESLVPWNYNGFPLLNDAGNQKLQEIVTYMQVGEMGSVTVPGTPAINIGDVLIAGGPNITGIDVQVGEGGVTTTYSIRTYTPKFGAFAKYNADRIARLVKLHQQVKRGMKQLFRYNDLKRLKSGGKNG